MKNKRVLDIIVPVYNEEKNIQLFIKKISKTLKNFNNYKVIFCMDPSSDNTEKIITQNIKTNKKLSLLKLSRRFGQPEAIMAGIKNSNSKYLVIIDADLQDPPELILDLYNKAEEGFDVVLAKRNKRDGENVIKLFVSYVGYRIINFLSDVKIEPDVGDFRIINEKVTEHLKKIDEPAPFLRGLVAYVGFNTATISYNRLKRNYGKGNYNRFFGSYDIGVNGIFSFSSSLLTYILFSGIFISIISLIFLFYIFTAYFFDLNNFPLGYPSIIVAIFFFGGIQLVAIGVLGEYIGRIFNHVKKRPNHIVENKINL